MAVRSWALVEGGGKAIKRTLPANLPHELGTEEAKVGMKLHHCLARSSEGLSKCFTRLKGP